MIGLGIRVRVALVEFATATLTLHALIITEDEWIFLAELYEVLEPLQEETQQVSQKAPTITQSVNVYQKLDDLLYDVTTKAGIYATINEKIRLAVCKGLEVLEEYTAKIDSNIIYYIASILDPRIKTVQLREHLKEDADTVIDNIRTTLKKDYLVLSTPALSTAASSSTITTASKGFRVSTSQRRMHERIQQLYYGEECITNEIDDYLDSKPVKTPPSTNSTTAEDDLAQVLNWWRTNQFVYPRMARIARDFIGIAAAEVGVERLFSQGRDQIGLRRYSLLPATMKMLTMLKAFFSDDYYRQALTEEEIQAAIESDLEI